MVGIGGGIFAGDSGHSVISMGSQGVVFDEWRMNRPNKTLQATAAALCALAVARTHNAVVAGVSAPPAAVPELGR